MFFRKIFFFTLLSLVFAVPVFADDYGLSETAGAAGLDKYGTSIPAMIGNVLGTGLSLIGVLFFALMLYGGVMWMIAHGNSEQEKKALDTITAAIIGVLIVLGSYALTSFVFNNMLKGGGDKSLGDTKGEEGDKQYYCKCDDKVVEGVSDKTLCEFLATVQVEGWEQYTKCSWNNGNICKCDSVDINDWSELGESYKTKSVCEFLPQISNEFTDYQKCEWKTK